jgi:dihydroorotase
VKAIDGIVIQVPGDKSIGATGIMNEGIISTRLGLPGKPAMAEELMISRDIELAAYADSKLHFTGVSTAKTIQYIKEAKHAGLRVSCSVTPYHLYFSDEDLQNYDTNLKVDPPLRTISDRATLKAALLDGTIDCIASHHIPQNYDNKVCEFEYAKNGMVGLESLFGIVWSLVKTDWDLVKLINLLTTAPRSLFGIAQPVFQEGALASLTLFNPAAVFVFEEKNIRSKSKNSAFTGHHLSGQVIGTVNGNTIHLN